MPLSPRIISSSDSATTPRQSFQVASCGRGLSRCDAAGVVSVLTLLCRVPWQGLIDIDRFLPHYCLRSITTVSPCFLMNPTFPHYYHIIMRLYSLLHESDLLIFTLRLSEISKCGTIDAYQSYRSNDRVKSYFPIYN